MFFRNFLFCCLLAVTAPVSAMAAHATGDIYAIVNIDLLPNEQIEGEKLLIAYLNQMKHDPNILRISLIQQVGGASNHFILMETFTNEASYRRFIELEAVRRFREVLYPYLGSPWDERLGREVLP
jgi:quinol monooxygenase YgiN